MSRLPLLCLLLCGASVLGAEPAELDRAAKLLFNKKLPEAAKALESVWKVNDLSHESVLRTLELQGITLAQLGQDAKAKAAFQTLLVLEPKHELSGKFPSAVEEAFAEAKQWVGSNGPLSFRPADAETDTKGRVVQVAAKMKNDKLKLVRGARFHTRADGGAWLEMSAEVQGTYAAVSTNGAGVEWWAELLGEGGRVLMLIGNPLEPVREGAAKKLKGAASPPPAEVAQATPPPPRAEPPPRHEPPSDAPTERHVDRLEPTPPPVTDPELELGRSSSGSVLRPVGYSLLAVGAAGVGVGVIFGLQSKGARDQLSSLMPNEQGVIDSITQKKAFELDAQAREQALVANILFGVGGGLALAGGICVIVGSTGGGDEGVAIAPAPMGVTASGRF